MLIRPELIERLADTLEGIPMTHAGTPASGGLREASVLIYHSGRPKGGGGPLAGESPLLEINLSETDTETSVLVNSALGMVELHGIDEIRLLEATEEAAFYSSGASGKISFLTVGSRGVLQLYVNIAQSLQDAELADVADADLRAAVALKIFAENAEVFRNDA